MVRFIFYQRRASNSTSSLSKLFRYYYLKAIVSLTLGRVRRKLHNDGPYQKHIPSEPLVPLSQRSISEQQAALNLAAMATPSLPADNTNMLINAMIVSFNFSLPVHTTKSGSYVLWPPVSRATYMTSALAPDSKLTFRENRARLQRQLSISWRSLTPCH